MIPEKTATSVCQEFLPNAGPRFKVVTSNDGYMDTIETVVSMDQLSALSMRMYSLGWLLNDVHGVISKIKAGTNIQTDPIVYVEYLYPESFNLHDQVPQCFPLN